MIFKGYMPMGGLLYLIFVMLYWGKLLTVGALSPLEIIFYSVVQTLIAFMLIYTHILSWNFCRPEVIQALRKVRLYELFLYSYANWGLLLFALVINVCLHQISLIYSFISVNFQIGFLTVSYLITVFGYFQYQKYYEKIPQLDENVTKNLISKYNIFLI